jgi:uncharacterized protein (TIGR03067 family)
LASLANNVNDLDGVWLPVAAFVAGEVVPIRELRIARFVLIAGRYEIVDSELRVLDTGAITIDRAVLPCSMDIVGLDGPNAGKTMLAIFELDRDLLTICYDLDVNVRPETLEPQEDQLLLQITYARAGQRLS